MNQQTATAQAARLRDFLVRAVIRRHQSGTFSVVVGKALLRSVAEVDQFIKDLDNGDDCSDSEEEG